MLNRFPRRFAATASLLATTALAIGALPAAAADSGDIVVSGGSVERILLTIPDAAVDFGDNLTPDGDPSNSATDTIVEYVDGVNDPSFGACYAWDGSVRVRSNVTYDLTVASDTDVGRLGFLTSSPTDFASCASGEAALVSTAMFATADPVGGWAFDQTRTRRSSHDFSLGLEVLWEDDASATLADTTLTITAQAAT
jgi:hypothetical protein